MKRNKLFSLLLLLLTALLLTSCLKDQDDYFDEPATTRLSQYESKARATLMDAPYGWLFEIYKSSATLDEYGGYAFTCKFDSLTVDVRSELDTTKLVTSYYKITSETAATLTFDTYNELIHEFAEGTASLYQGYEGDVEYVIDSIGTDIIKVHGARSNRTYYLRKLDRPAKEYLQEQATFRDSYSDASYTAFSGDVNGVSVSGEVNTGDLSAAVTVDSTEQTRYFTFTSTGIRFQSPIQVGDASISELVFNSADHSYSVTDSKGQTYTLEGAFPEWVRLYNAWEGEWTLTYRTSASGSDHNVDVTLVPTADRSEYLLRGLANAYDIHLRYIKDANALEFYTQYADTPLPNGDVVRVRLYDAAAGSIASNANYGLRTSWNEENGNYDFVDNGVWGNRTATGLYLYEYTAAHASVGRLSTDYTDYLLNGAYRLQYITSLTKKN